MENTVACLGPAKPEAWFSPPTTRKVNPSELNKQPRTRDVDALLARVAAGAHMLTPDTTVILDEAGMADTDRLQRLVVAVEQAGSKLVLVGDSHQLASIGPGGLFARIAEIAPTAERGPSLPRREVKAAAVRLRFTTRKLCCPLRRLTGAERQHARAWICESKLGRRAAGWSLVWARGAVSG